MLAILLILLGLILRAPAPLRDILPIAPLHSQGSRFAKCGNAPHCIKFTPQSETGPETRRRPLNPPSGVSTSVNLISPLPNRRLIG